MMYRGIDGAGGFGVQGAGLRRSTVDIYLASWHDPYLGRLATPLHSSRVDYGFAEHCLPTIRTLGKQDDELFAHVRIRASDYTFGLKTVEGGWPVPSQFLGHRPTVSWKHKVKSVRFGGMRHGRRAEYDEAAHMDGSDLYRDQGNGGGCCSCCSASSTIDRVVDDMS